MKSPQCKVLIVTIIAVVVAVLLAPSSQAFHPLASQPRRSVLRLADSKVVQVCGFKDCRARGGGARLQKLITTVVEEEGLNDQITVERCDCQGECGYGPNVVVDGKIVNGVKGRDAVLNIILPDDNDQQDE